MGGASKINIETLETGAQGNQGFQGGTGFQGFQGNTGGAQGAQGAQGNQGFQGSIPIANETTNTASTVDISYVMGNYCNMASANSTAAFSVIPANPTVLGGFARILINGTAQPTLTGTPTPVLIAGDAWLLSTDMYLTIQWNGVATEYWFEQIAP